MNDRYLFKAKRKNWKELPEKYWWVHWNIFSGCPEAIDESTICACTGLKDWNGKLVWENDVVYARCNGLSGKGVVKFENGCFVLKDHKRNRTYSLFGEWKFRVDGNIFDNGGDCFW